MKQPPADRPFRLFVKAMLGLSAISVLLLCLNALGNSQGFADWYLLWNLFLAWIPLTLAYWLVQRLQRHAWSSWGNIAISLAWLLFLPNSFYMVSDLIHLDDMPRDNVLFDSLTFTSFVLAGLILGFVSLYLVQRELRRRTNRFQSEVFAAIMLFLSSFAIYLGRELRWNSWDVLVNPAGILFDISERLIDPLGHPTAFTTTGIFLLFLGGLYWVLTYLFRAIGLYARSQDSW